jgi:hypothetical protein
MTQQAQVLVRENRLGAGQEVTTVSPQTETPLPEGHERFAAYVAHELRTPLATQRALLELALSDPYANATSWREIGEDVLAACMRQERLLEACLTLARSQGRRPRLETVNLAAIAAEELQAHDLGELESVVALEPARTAGDPDPLEPSSPTSSRTRSATTLSAGGFGSQPAPRQDTLFSRSPTLARSSQPSNSGVSSNPSSDSTRTPWA